jgi:hypothetical protein
MKKYYIFRWKINKIIHVIKMIISPEYRKQQRSYIIHLEESRKEIEELLK